MKCGQFEDILMRFNWTISDDQRHKAHEAFTNLKCQLTGINANQPNVGLANICENGKIAYDLHQVIRHQIAIDNDSNSLNIDLDTPMQISNEEMASIERIK
jgi:hypothetical protein